MARTEFRFVIDGLDLSEEQHDQIARAIQEAGARAAAGFVKGPALGIDVGRIGNELEWIGRILLAEERAIEAAQQLQQVGGFTRAE